MHRSGWQQLKENRKKGVSLAVVLCVSAFFIAFAAAILYTAGLLTSRSSERLQEERSYQLARSFSKVLGTELEAYSQKDEPDVSGTFYQFANLFLDETRYQEYSKDNPKSTSYQFVVDGTTAGNLFQDTVGGGYGNLRVTLRKEPNETEISLSDGEITVVSGTAANYETQIEQLKNMTVREYILDLDVTAYVGKLFYTYSTEYTREEKYDVTFSHNGKTIVWDDTGKQWKVGNSAGEIYDPSANASVPIKYSFNRSRTTSCQFVENTYTEGGGQSGD